MVDGIARLILFCCCLDSILFLNQGRHAIESGKAMHAFELSIPKWLLHRNRNMRRASSLGSRLPGVFQVLVLLELFIPEHLHRPSKVKRGVVALADAVGSHRVRHHREQLVVPDQFVG